jgi:hypothetical protein
MLLALTSLVADAGTVPAGGTQTFTMAGGTTVTVTAGANPVNVNLSGGDPPTKIDVIIDGHGDSNENTVECRIVVDEEDDAGIANGSLELNVIINGDNNMVVIAGGAVTGDVDCNLIYGKAPAAAGGADGNVVQMGTPAAAGPPPVAAVPANGWDIDHQGDASSHADGNTTRIGRDAAGDTVPCNDVDTVFGPNTERNNVFCGTTCTGCDSTNNGVRSGPNRNVQHDPSGGQHS